MESYYFHRHMNPNTKQQQKHNQNQTTTPQLQSPKRIMNANEACIATGTEWEQSSRNVVQKAERK